MASDVGTRVVPRILTYTPSPQGTYPSSSVTGTLVARDGCLYLEFTNRYFVLYFPRDEVRWEINENKNGIVINGTLIELGSRLSARGVIITAPVSTIPGFDDMQGCAGGDVVMIVPGPIEIL